MAADDSLRPSPVPAEEPGSPNGVRAVASDKAEDVPDDKDFFSCNICYEVGHVRRVSPLGCLVLVEVCMPTRNPRSSPGLVISLPAPSRPPPPRRP